MSDEVRTALAAVVDGVCTGDLRLRQGQPPIIGAVTVGAGLRTMSFDVVGMGIDPCLAHDMHAVRPTVGSCSQL